MSKQIKFAILGYGHIGKKHSAMVAGNDDSTVAAVAEPDDARRKAAAEAGYTVFKNEDELFAAKIAIDVVCVCTPNGLHASQALKALEAKCHVVVEKPMGLTRVQCEEIIYKSLQVSKHVFCVKQNRYSPSSEWLKSLMVEERLGKIAMVNLRCFWNRDERYYKKNHWKGTKDMDGGVLFTQFSHFIDIMYWLMGDITNIQSRFTNFNHQHNTEFIDSGVVNFEFVNGGMGALSFSTSVWGQNMESSITLVGEKGSVIVSGQYMDTVTYCHIEDYEMPKLRAPNPPNDYGDYKGSAANHHYVIENVINVIQGKSAISTNALEGMKVVEMIERIHQAGGVE